MMHIFLNRDNDRRCYGCREIYGDVSTPTRYRGIRKALSRGTRPDGGREAPGQNEVCNDQSRGDPGWDTAAVLPNCRGLFPIPEGIASVCAVRRWQRNPCPCCQDLEWWCSDFPGRGRANVHFWQQLPVGPAKSARVTLMSSPCASAIYGRSRNACRTYAFCSFSLREKVGMRGSIRKNALFFNPLTLALSRRERGLKPLFGKSWLGE